MLAVSYHLRLPIYLNMVSRYTCSISLTATEVRPNLVDLVALNLVALKCNSSVALIAMNLSDVSFIPSIGYPWNTESNSKDTVFSQ